MTNLSGINLNNGSAVGSKREGMDSPSKGLALMPRYVAYKDSYSDYSGLIPCEWKLIPIRAIFEERNEKNTGPKTDHILSVTRDRGVIPYDEKGAIGNNKSEDIERYKLVYENDLVINKMNVVIGSLGLSKYFGALSQVYIVLRPKTKSFNIRYYAYLFHNEPFYKSLIRYCTGIMELRESLNKEQFKQLYLPFPTFEEQTLIANFLDMKTAQIDDAIAIKEQQISLLKERKQIIIQQAVTQGLDPNVPMKDSGVDWIGKIPAHWDCAKLKYYIDILPGYAFKSEQYSLKESDIKLLRGINVSPDLVKWEEVVYWPSSKIKGLEKYDMQEGDLVIAMDRPWVSSGIRVAEISKKDLPCMLLQRVGRIRGNSGSLTSYIKLLLSTNLFLSYFEPMLTGISVPHISSDQIEDFRTPIPPLQEQREILDFVNRQTNYFDHAIESTLQQIEKLKEYKTTLINSAVTGKKKITPEIVEQ